MKGYIIISFRHMREKASKHWAIYLLKKKGEVAGLWAKLAGERENERKRDRVRSEEREAYFSFVPWGANIQAVLVISPDVGVDHWGSCGSWKKPALSPPAEAQFGATSRWKGGENHELPAGSAPAPGGCTLSGRGPPPRVQKCASSRPWVARTSRRN